MKLKCLSLLLGVLFILGDLDAAPKKLTLGDLQMIGVIPRVDEDLPKLNCAGSGRLSNATIEGEGEDDGDYFETGPETGRYIRFKKSHSIVTLISEVFNCDENFEMESFTSRCYLHWVKFDNFQLEAFKTHSRNRAREACEEDIFEKMQKLKCPQAIECKDSNGVDHSYECRQTWYPEEPECPNIVPAQFIKLSTSELIREKLENNMCQWVCRVGLQARSASAWGTAETSCGGCANH